MITNFFEIVKDYVGNGVSLNITIAQKDDKYTVSLIQRHNDVKDAAAKKIVPLTATGTIEELNEGFYDVFNRPLIETKGLLINMKDYESSVQLVEKEKKEAKDAKSKEDELNKANFKKHKELAEKEEKSENYQEAINQYTLALKFASSGEKSLIQNKINELKPKAVPSLFDDFANVNTPLPNSIEDMLEEQEDQQEEQEEDIEPF